MSRLLSIHTLPLAVLLAAGLATSACSRSNDRQSGGSSDSPAAASTPQDWAALKDFRRIDVTGPDNVVVTIGPKFSVTADGDAKSIALLDIKVKGDRLLIGRRSEGMWNKVDGGRGATIHVTLPAIAAIDVTGSGDFILDRAEGAELALSLTGSGDLDIGQVKLGTLKAEITGTGSITLAGTADQGDLSVTGTGDIDAAGLRLGRASADILGTGDIDFASDGPVAIKIMGTGDVNVKGKAQCTTNAMGPGEAHCGP
ncbi:head GIN domain-containing protein [Sphingobium sp. AP49]|uniref:head GIN domain-containing protein n=1 Tax=Sphingobium sp. AP49 TaxID=1144307 RepID=UPI00026ECF2E|nr:head GIN domain-containing protein [Sphingobium sp. AP49]WHO40472.1 head GIN domain-containing protein [Sphingobium sp. AP49]